MTVGERVNAERLVLASWPRAILLQIAHPLIAAGVAAHSSFRESPIASARRLHQTVRAMLMITFGTAAERDRALGEIRAIHRRVNGTLRESVGPFPAGTRYSAEDPSLLLWVHATLIESTVLVYEALIGELTPADRDEYCREAAEVAITLGAREDSMPRDWNALRCYIDSVHTSHVLAVGTDARVVAAAVLQDRLRLVAGPVTWMNRRLTAGWLPPNVRELYGFTWSKGRERQFNGLVASLRHMRRTLPRAIAHWPAARKKKA